MKLINPYVQLKLLDGYNLIDIILNDKKCSEKSVNFQNMWDVIICGNNTLWKLEQH